MPDGGKITKTQTVESAQQARSVADSLLESVLKADAVKILGVGLEPSAVERIIEAIMDSAYGPAEAGAGKPAPPEQPKTPAKKQAPAAQEQAAPAGRKQKPFAERMLTHPRTQKAAAVGAVAQLTALGGITAAVMNASLALAGRLPPEMNEEELGKAYSKPMLAWKGFNEKFFRSNDKLTKELLGPRPEEPEIEETAAPEPGRVPAGPAGVAAPGAVSGQPAMASILREAQMRQRIAQSRALPEIPRGGMGIGIGGGRGGAGEAAMAALPGMLGAGEDEEAMEEEEAAEDEAEEQAVAGQRLQMRRMASRIMKMKTGVGEEEMREKMRAEIREAATKAAKRAIREGIKWLANLTGVTLDASTVGISTVLTVFMYAITLGDWNMQMIWGYYVTKKKSLLFPPLEWKPLPIPLPDIWLHAGVVIIDIIILLVLLVMCVLIFIILFGVQLATAGSLAFLLAYFTDPATQAFVNDILSGFVNFLL